MIILEQTRTADPLSGHLFQSYAVTQRLYNSQPTVVQHFLSDQAKGIANALLDRPEQIRFRLPDRIIIHSDQVEQETIPIEMREQVVGSFLNRFTHADIRFLLNQRLKELENGSSQAAAAAAALLRFCTAVYMVHTLLPMGQRVYYTMDDGEEIPSKPVAVRDSNNSAITAPDDAIAEQKENDPQHDNLVVPYVPAAWNFFLPQWVAFDEEDRLVVGTFNEAVGYIQSMQQFLDILHTASSLAPYIISDPLYQQKRYGILGQLVNQGRALARYETQDIIRTIKQRARNNSLNRGLSLSMQYFNDQTLRIEKHEFEVIPAGWIVFIPGFVVRAAREETAKVAQDTRLSPSTRRHLLVELHKLEVAFEHRAKHKLVS